MCVCVCHEPCRAAVDQLTEVLLERERVEGVEVESLVLRLATAQDLKGLGDAKELAML